MWKGRQRTSSSLCCCSLCLSCLPSAPHPWKHSHRGHILSKRPWNGELRHHLSHGKRKVAILPAHGSFARCSQISSYSLLVTSQGVGALVAWEFFRACGQTSHPQTARDVHACSRADIRLWVRELCVSLSTKPSSAAPPCQYFSTTSCVCQEVKYIWVWPTTRSQLTQEFVHIWSLCFT